MPLLLEIAENNFQIKIWQITEEIDFFLDVISFSSTEKEEYSRIKHEKRQKEWLASRYLLKIISPDLRIEKDKYGNPHAKGIEGDISISHCRGYAAVGFSTVKKIGIDIEPIHEKIQRIKHKFLSEKELQHLDKKDETAHLITHWCIKEAAYKWYGKKSLAFKENIIIHPFTLSEDKANVNLIGKDDTYQLTIDIKKIENCIFTYIIK